MDYRLEPFRALLQDVSGDDGAGLGFAELRDALLAVKPLDLDHVKSINRAEAEFWRRSQGTHVGDSSTKLNVAVSSECGGANLHDHTAIPRRPAVGQRVRDLRRSPTAQRHY